VNIFQNSKWRQEYAIEINNRFEILENMDDEVDSDKIIDDKWESITTITKETKQHLIGKGGSTEILRNKWYDEECKIAIEEMNKAREKWLKKKEGKMKNRSITIKEKKHTK
jgi:hypothetical protein